jgi:predicted transposase/invertase (TIGR01784 family)
MEQLNGLGEIIASTPQEDVKLDAYIKNILAFKPILARIFKETIEECKDMEYDEIERCIEGDIDITLIGLNPGMSNPTKIEGNMQEDFVNGEGKITYDIRTTIRIPKSSDRIGVKILVDVEAQKDDNPGYDIVERAIFYCCRMISAQLSTEFTNKTADNVKYGNLKKVYSIWVCTETSQEKANTIEVYNIQRNVYPNTKNKKEPRYDLLEAVIINISKNHNVGDTDSKLIHLLTDLFNEKMDAANKLDVLKKEYGISTTVEFEREVFGMTAYAARLIKEGLEEGRMKGREEGREEGRAEGREEGREEGRAEGREEERISAVQRMIQADFLKEDILKLHYTEEEYQKAKETLLITV